MPPPFDPFEFGTIVQTLYSEEAGKRVDIQFVKVEGGGLNLESEIGLAKY